MRDRYERRHRRTVRHPEAMETMASANFDAVPSLAEALGLEDTVTHTHVGYRKDTGYLRQRSSKRHALRVGQDGFGSPCYVALCGEIIWLVDKDMYGDAIAPNIRAWKEACVFSVTCKRCLQLIK